MPIVVGLQHVAFLKDLNAAVFFSILICFDTLFTWRRSMWKCFFFFFFQCLTLLFVFSDVINTLLGEGTFGKVLDCYDRLVSCFTRDINRRIILLNFVSVKPKEH